MLSEYLISRLSTSYTVAFRKIANNETEFMRIWYREATDDDSYFIEFMLLTLAIMTYTEVIGIFPFTTYWADSSTLTSY